MKLLNSTPVKYVILIIKNKKVLYKLIYLLLANKLRVLREYLKISMRKGWIRRSKSLINALILFMSKKNDNLRLYMNYKGLNKIIIRNKHSLLLINKILN